ncbi:hypothetical protein, partial [Pseudoxanthomonas winnipegensis]|uniref:hypothetical protein n=1 Tax=Pseudoxanthomonas winnipegensis TaxID=2480810 RepID=UPI0019811B96
SITCFTASAWNSSVYCLLLPINTSVIAINYGNRMSTKGWPVQALTNKACAALGGDLFRRHSFMAHALSGTLRRTLDIAIATMTRVIDTHS